MRHPVSPNQMVMWTHHQLTEAWAPTGIMHPPQRDTATPDRAAREVGQGEGAGEMNRGIDPEAPARPATTVLTRDGGACGQVVLRSRRAWQSQRGGAPAQQRARIHDLV